MHTQPLDPIIYKHHMSLDVDPRLVRKVLDVRADHRYRKRPISAMIGACRYQLQTPHAARRSCGVRLRGSTVLVTGRLFRGCPVSCAHSCRQPLIIYRHHNRPGTCRERREGPSTGTSDEAFVVSVSSTTFSMRLYSGN